MKLSVFSSARETRLWLWTLAVVVAIYSTLGLASILAEALRERGMNDNMAAVGFLTAMFLIGLTVLTQGLKMRPCGTEIAIALGVAVVYLMVFFRMAILERSHLIEYSVVAVFIYEALKERMSRGRNVPVPAVLAVLAASMVGLLDECIQAVLPSRVFDPIDIFFNSMAATMAVVASVVLAWARKKVTKKPVNIDR